MQFKYLWCTSQQTFHVPCLLFTMSHGTTTENIYLHQWLSLTSIENRSHISSPSWDYLKNHGMCDISSTVISSMSSLVLELWHSMSLCTVWRCPRDDSLIWRISWKMTQFWTATGKETISINILVETGWFYEQNSKQSSWRIPHPSASQTKFSPEKLKKNIH